MMTKALAGMNVRYVEFHNRYINTFDRVMKGNRCMRKGAGIDCHTATLLTGFMNPADQITLVVALMANYVKTVFFAESNALGLNIRKGLRPVNARFALTEQIQVRSVENVNGFGDSRSHLTGSCH